MDNEVKGILFHSVSLRHISRV